MAEGASKYSDGVYARRPWTAPAEAAYPPQEYIGPFQSNQERLLSQSLAAWTMPRADLQEYVRPPLPQIRLFPDRLGYGDRSQPGIEDIVTIDRVYTEPRVSWYSGGAAGFGGTSRNYLGTN